MLACIISNIKYCKIVSPVISHLNIKETAISATISQKQRRLRLQKRQVQRVVHSISPPLQRLAELRYQQHFLYITGFAGDAEATTGEIGVVFYRLFVGVWIMCGLIWMASTLSAISESMSHVMTAKTNDNLKPNNDNEMTDVEKDKVQLILLYPFLIPVYMF